MSTLPVGTEEGWEDEDGETEGNSVGLLLCDGAKLWWLDGRVLAVGLWDADG